LDNNGHISIVFSVQGTGGSLTGPDPENRVGDQDNGSPGRPDSSGLQVPNELGHCCARTRPPWWPSRPATFFLQNVLQLHQQRWVIFCSDSLALWKIINKEDAVLIPKNRGENFSRGFLHLWGNNCQQSLNKRLGHSHSQSGCVGEEINSAHSTVAILSTVSFLHISTQKTDHVTPHM